MLFSLSVSLLSHCHILSVIYLLFPINRWGEGCTRSHCSLCHLPSSYPSYLYNFLRLPKPRHPLQSEWPSLCQEHAISGCPFCVGLSFPYPGTATLFLSGICWHVPFSWSAPRQPYLALKSAPFPGHSQFSFSWMLVLKKKYSTHSNVYNIIIYHVYNLLCDFFLH